MTDTRLICPLTDTTVAAMKQNIAAAAQAGADMAECRLDFLQPLPTDADLAALLNDSPLPVLATCRPVRQGGQYEGDEAARLALLAKAAEHQAVVAVDIENDVPAADRPAITAAEVILSHHDFDRLPADLDKIAADMEASAATVNKVAFAAAGPEDALRSFDVIRGAAKPTLALAMGEAGLPSRILARKFAAWGTFGSLAAGKESAPGQPTIADLKKLYRWDAQQSDTKVYGVIGCPVAHSMSPAIHNAAFDTTAINGVYLPLRIEPGAENFDRFMDAALARPWLGLSGLSVTIPHKENALAYVGQDNCDPLAVKIGAVNTITIAPDGSLRGDNTDYAGAIDALVQKMGVAREDLAGRKVAVLGAGGASRAVVAALAHYQADVTIYNRTLSRADALAEEFGCRSAALAAATSTDAEILINCTAIGMHPNIDDTPMDCPALPGSLKVVFDTVYNPLQTRLLTQAQAAGCLTVSGLDMFVNQAVAQFEIWTATPAPREVMRDVVLARLQG